MKLTILIVTVSILSCLSAETYSQTTKLTIAENNSTLLNVLRAIEGQSEFKFFYNEKVDVNKQVSVEVTQKSVTDILDKVLSTTSIKYKVLGRQIALYDKNEMEPFISEQQGKKVTGKVTDSSGGSLPGVAVVIKGTTTGVITDNNGSYSLTNLPENAILQFSFVGMKMQEITIGSKSTVDVKLTDEATGIEEVVAIGYGTMKKSDLTGSSSRVSLGDKAAPSNTNLLQALSGVSAGVNVQGSGLSGTEPNLSIRGQTSLSASDRPLIVRDGIIYNGDIADINISDVESVDILKDASSAAVYGSRSANGVMLITTKKGKSEKPSVSFNMSYGFQDMTNNPMKVMNGEQYAERLVDYYYQQNLYTWYKTKPTSATGKPVRPDITDRNIVAARLRTQEERDNYLAGNETNWVDEITRIAPIQNYNLSFSGKTEKSNYFVSASYAKEEGIQMNDQFSRITLNSNVESKITDWFTLGLISSYSYRDYSGIEASLASARVASPFANNKIGQPSHDMYLTGEAYMPFPLNNLYIDNSDIRNNLFLVGSGKITVPWVKGLTYELNYSTTYLTRNNNTFYPVTTPEGSGNKGQAIKNPYEERNSIVNNIVTYLRTIGNHQVNATLLYSRENRNAQSSTLNAQGFDNPVLGYNNMGLGTVATVASTAWEENSLSYMARANYTYKNRYMATATIRRDGFSGFGANNKFANFPSVSIGWVASEESFLKDMTSVYLKLRASYGKNGNQGIGRYSSYSRMTPDAYVYGATTAIAVYPSTLGNTDLGWETTSSYNLGLDYAFLDHRISGSIDVYKAKTTDVLVKRALPPAAGYPNIWANIGAIDNKGIELQLNTINLTGRLNWTTNFIFSLNRDKISKLYGGANDKDVGNSWFVGEPISALYDYKMAGGLWTEEELYSGKSLANWYPGQFKYVDQNKDGIIEPNADRTIIGYKTPNYRFSINNLLSYDNFSFSFLVNSIQGGNDYYLENNSSVVNVDWRSDNVYRINASAVRPYWTPDNGVNNATGVYNSPAVASGVYESRSFVRLQDVSLSYNFGPKLLRSLKIANCQFFVSGKNLYTWTKWSGWDPEAGVTDYPIMRNITTGFRITL
ncbi:MAG: TonB-dependent receptor [Mariniphaga sp.]|nr:TonB-dependent receptor [Mariniphaga sp.]